MIAYLDKYDTTVEVPDDISEKDLADVNENFHSYVNPPTQTPGTAATPTPPVVPGAPTEPAWKQNFYESAVKPALATVLHPAVALGEATESPEARAFGGKLVEQGTFGLTKPVTDALFSQEYKEHPAFAGAGAVVGGVGSLMATGGALRIAGLDAKAGLAGKAAVEAGFEAGSRFIPRAIMTGATFGTRTFIAETVKAFEEGGVNLTQFGEHVLKDTAFGSIFGSIGGLESVKASVASAGALGFLSSKMEGSDNLEATLHGIIWGAFEAVGSGGRSEAIRLEALGNLKESIGEYVGARNPDISEKDAARAASQFVDNAVRKAGFDTAEDLARSGPENLLEGIEKVNQIVRNAKIPNAGPVSEPLLPKLPAPVEPAPAETAVTPAAPPQTPFDKAVDYVKDIFGMKPEQATEPTVEAKPRDLKTEIATAVSNISERLTTLGMKDNEVDAVMSVYGMDKTAALGKEVVPTDTFRLPIDEQYMDAYDALAKERGIVEVSRPEMDEWREVLKTGIKPPPEDVKGEYAELPLWMKKKTGRSYDEVAQELQERSLLQPGEDFWKKLRELRVSKRPEKYDTKTMIDAQRAVDLMNDHFNPRSQEVAAFAAENAGKDEQDVAQLAHNAGLLDEPNADLMKLEIQKAKQEQIVGVEPENITARYERLIKQAMDQGFNRPQAETWAKSQLGGITPKAEQKPEQKEFGEAGGVKSFGRGKQGEGELQFSMAPPKTEGIQPAFFSMVERTITQKMSGKAAGNDVLAMLRNTPGIKQDELDWIGLPEFLKDKSSVTKMEVQDFVRQNQVQIKEVTKQEPEAVGNFAKWAGKQGYTPDEITQEWNSRGKLYDEYQKINMPPDAPKFASYQLPGGENYRELLLTLPSNIDVGSIKQKQAEAGKRIDELMRVFTAGGLNDKAWALRERAIEPESLSPAWQERARQLVVAQEYINRNPEVEPTRGESDFKSSHFEEPNILAHVRFNDRTDADGKRVLFLEEVQSDWHQKGREQGYATDRPSEGNLNARLNTSRRGSWEIADQTGEVVGYLSTAVYPKAEEAEKYANENRGQFNRVFREGVPDAPFKKTWHELALKWMLRYAAENGYDKIAWTTGEQQAERYDLSKQISEVRYFPGKNLLQAWKNNVSPDVYQEPVIEESNVSKEKLSDFIGKDAAGKILAGEQNKDGFISLKGQDLKVGGEGMKGFYDQMIPSFLNKYTKKWGGRVEETNLDIGGFKGSREDFEVGEGEITLDTVHSLDLTRDMKLSVMQGQPQFSMAPNAAPPKLVRPAKIPIKEATAQAAFKIKESANEITNLVNPSAAAPLAAQITREQLGKMARSYDMAEASLEQAKKLFDSLSKEANIGFIDQMERGQNLKEPIAKQLRKLLDDKREEVRALGKGKLESFIENYFPHIWDQGEKAVGQAIQKAAKRPFEGSKGFLKKRSIEFTKDGIEMGLTPVSYNPVDLVLLKIREMDKFIMAHRTINEFKQNGLAKYVKVGGEYPEGWVKIDDRISTIFKSPMVAVKEAFDAKVMGDLENVAKAHGIDLERSMRAKGEGQKLKDVWGLSRSTTPGEAGKVWTKFAGPESALAHELGHQIDNIYGLQGKFLADPKIREELTNLANERVPEDAGEAFKNYVQTPEEKMAAMLEAYIHAPELLKETAPKTYAKLSAFLKSQPKLEPLTAIKPGLLMGTGESEVYAGGSVIAGHIYAQPDAARIINNYLSPGLQKSALYQAYRYAGNLINQFQLGLSAFHLGFTSLDATVSKFALALEQLETGHPLKAIRDALASPFAPVTNIIRGNELLKAWRGQGQNQSDNILAEAMASGGGRARMDQFYATRAYEQMKHHFQAGNVIRGILHIPMSIAEISSKPILEYIVPRQKLGVFADLMKMEIENNPGMTHAQLREKAQRAWDSVDNRMGQLVYDNLFWNRTFKDLLMGTTRSVGWNLGTLREIPGGVREGVVAGARLLKGEKPEELHKMNYDIALAFIVGVMGAVTCYLATGKGPKELKDYYFPPTRGLDEHGDPRRISFPSYMKDVYHYTQAPFRTLLNKTNPLISMVAQMLENKDYFGTKIRNEDDPLVKQAASEVAYMLKQMQPFSIRNMQKNLETGNKSLFDTIGPWVGITPAPYDINQTKAEKLAHEIAASHQEIGGRTHDQAERSKLLNDLTRQYRMGDPKATDNLYKAFQAGVISHAQMRSVITNAQLTPLQKMVKGFSVEEAERVYAKADDEEKAQIERIVRRKEAVHGGQFVAP